MAKGTGDSAHANEDRWGYNAEVDLQYGNRTEDNSGWAVQAKVPLVFTFSTLDVYYEIPSSHPHYFGIGIEGGFLSGLYATYSYYFTESLYFTFTPQAHYYFGEVRLEAKAGNPEKENRLAHIWLNPQIAFGMRPGDGTIDISLYASYNRVLGDGADFQLCLFDYTNACEKRDLRTDFLQFGTQFRF